MGARWRCCQQIDTTILGLLEVHEGEEDCGKVCHAAWQLLQELDAELSAEELATQPFGQVAMDDKQEASNNS